MQRSGAVFACSSIRSTVLKIKLNSSNGGCSSFSYHGNWIFQKYVLNSPDSVEYMIIV